MALSKYQLICEQDYFLNLPTRTFDTYYIPGEQSPLKEREPPVD